MLTKFTFTPSLQPNPFTMVEEVKQEAGEYQHKFDDVKLKTNFALTQLRMNKEPKDELVFLVQAIDEALTTGRLDKDEEFNNYISKTACNVLQKMAGERSYDQQVSSQPSDPCCDPNPWN